MIYLNGSCVVRIPLLILVLGISTCAYGFDSDAHMDLTRLSDFGPLLKLPDGQQAVRCRQRFIYGSSSPDKRGLINGRNPFNNWSHQQHAEKRAKRSFCGAVNNYRKSLTQGSLSAQCDAFEALGSAFHYLQDWGDPSKQVGGHEINWGQPCNLPDGNNPFNNRAPPNRFSDYIRQSVSCVIRLQQREVISYANTYARELEGKNQAALFDWVHASRQYHGREFKKYADGSPHWDADGNYWNQLLLRSAGILVAAQNRMLRDFVEHHYSGEVCKDEGLDDVITEFDGKGSVRSRQVRVCVVDINSVLDDHYDLYINQVYAGQVRNPKGGSSCFNHLLNAGRNVVQLRLVKKMGKSTHLKIDINNGEFSAQFSGSKDHNWAITAP